jgi:predicted nucleic acid-binding Zn ribbon protein
MQPVGPALQRVVAKALKNTPDAVVLAWPLACGNAVAERTRALALEDGILRVEVPDAAWRAQLNALVPRYIASLKSYVGDQVKAISFVLPAQK